jgi:hypothetical protein
MATLFIAEFRYIGATVGGNIQVAQGVPVAEQTVAIGGTSTQSSAFNAQTRFIRVHTDVICSIKIGTDPTASTTTARMAADQTEYFAVQPGDKIAVRTNT